MNHARRRSVHESDLRRARRDVAKNPHGEYCSNECERRNRRGVVVESLKALDNPTRAPLRVAERALRVINNLSCVALFHISFLPS